MFLIVAPPGPLRDALAAELGAGARVAEPADPPALLEAMRGVDRMFLDCADPVAAADVVAAAEMALVYYCVTLRPVPALQGSSVRSRALSPDGDPDGPPEHVAALAAAALREDPPSP